MNGPEHYGAAQEAVAHVDQLNDDPAAGDTGMIIAEGVAALTHAVLALVAVTIDAGADYPPAHDREWNEAQGRTR